MSNEREGILSILFWLINWSHGLSKEATQDDNDNSDYRKSLKIPRELDELRKAFIKFLKPFQNISAGHLENINMTTHQIQMTLSYIHIQHKNSPPYHAVLKARESEGKGIERVLEAREVESTQTKWASAFIFVPKKDWTLCFPYNIRN